MIRLRRQPGFTLVELVITLLVLGVLVTLAAPSFQGMRDRMRLKAAAEAISSHLQFARSESIKQFSNLYVQVIPGDGSVSANWCLGISSVDSCDCNQAGSCVYGPASNPSEKTLFSAGFPTVSLSSNSSSFKFGGQRARALAAGTITLAGSSGLALEIRVSPTGRILVCSDTVTGYPSCPT
jgi:type IV fimbrial biogenesis protein FimT